MLTNPQDRALTQQLINRLPALFGLVSSATESVIPNYNNLRLGNAPGQFTVGQQQNQQDQNQNLLGMPVGQPVVSVQIVASDLMNNPNTNSNQSNNTSNNSSNNNGQQNQSGNPRLPNDFAANLTSTINSFLPSLQGMLGGLIPGGVINPPQPNQPQHPQQSQQQSQQPSHQAQGNTASGTTSSQPSNIQAPNLSNTASTLSGALQGLMSNSSISGMLTP